MCYSWWVNISSFLFYIEIKTQDFSLWDRQIIAYTQRCMCLLFAVLLLNHFLNFIQGSLKYFGTQKMAISKAPHAVFFKSIILVWSLTNPRLPPIPSFALHTTYVNDPLKDFVKLTKNLWSKYSYLVIRSDYHHE